MSKAGFLAARNVSRETEERLSIYEALIRKWNPAINLVARSTLDDIWTRHFLDSAQIFDLANPPGGHWVDLGSGGGFPGLVIAVLAAEISPSLRVTLIESDGRKAAFLASALREMSLRAEVIATRVEALAPQGADFLSARALAALPVLIGFARHHLAPSGLAIFPKGAGQAPELAEARAVCQFSCETVPSVTDPAAAIHLIREIKHV